MSRNIQVNVVADTSVMEREMKKAQAQIRALQKQLDQGGGKNFSREMEQSSASTLGLAKAAGVAAGVFFGGAGLVHGLQASVDAAIEAQKVQANTQAQLKALNIDYQQHAAHIDEVIQKTSHLAAIDDEDLQSAFTNLVRVTRDVNSALELTGLAADIARGKNISLEAATQIVTKAQLGQLGALKRMGVEIPPVTTAVTELKDSKEKYTQAELAAAKAADAAATKQQAIAQLQKQFAGQAKAYGDTAAGAQERLHIATENLRESIGTALLPVVSKIANEVSDWTSDSHNLEKVQHAVNTAVDTGTDIIKAIWPEIKKTAGFADDLAQSVGGWENAFKLILGGTLLTKVTKLAGGFDGTNGLAGAVYRATLGITGKGGLLSALGSIPAKIGVTIAVAEIYDITKSIQHASDASTGSFSEDAAKGGYLNAGANLLYKGIFGKNYNPKGWAVDDRGVPVDPADLTSPDPMKRARARAAWTHGSAGDKAASAATPQTSTPAITKRAPIPNPGAVDRSRSRQTGSGGGSGGAGGGGSSSASAGNGISWWGKASEIAKVAGPSLAAAQDMQLTKLAYTGIRLFPNDLAGPMSGYSSASIEQDKARAQAAADAAKARVAKIAAAVESQRGLFGQAYAQLGEAGVRALEQKYQRMNAQLQTALRAQLAEIEKARQELTPAEKELADAEAARAAQQLQDNLDAAKASGDPKQVAEAEYQIWRAGKEKQAQAERAARDADAQAKADAAQTEYDHQVAHNDELLAQDKTAFQQRVSALGEYLSLREKSVSDANDRIRDVFGEFADGLDADIAVVLTKLANVRAAAGGASSGFAGSSPAVLPTGQSFYYPMADGGDFMVTRPTLFLAGEAGPERATFTPTRKGTGGNAAGLTLVIQADTIIGTSLERAAEELAGPIHKALLRKSRRGLALGLA